jgi:hypothetical protein
MMEAVSTFETSVNFYETTRRNIQEGHLHTRRLENLNIYRFLSVEILVAVKLSIPCCEAV